MRTKSFTFVVLFYVFSLQSQNSVYSVSPLVGDTISKYEKEKFALFQFVKANKFEYGFFTTKDSVNYQLHIKSLGNNMSTISYSIQEVSDIKLRIEAGQVEGKVYKNGDALKPLFRVHISNVPRINSANNSLKENLIADGYKGLYSDGGWFSSSDEIKGDPKVTSNSLGVNFGGDFSKGKWRFGFNYNAFEVTADAAKGASYYYQDGVRLQQKTLFKNYSFGCSRILVQNFKKKVSGSVEFGFHFIATTASTKINLEKWQYLNGQKISFYQDYNEFKNCYGALGFFRSDLYFFRYFSLYNSISYSLMDSLTVNEKEFDGYVISEQKISLNRPNFQIGVCMQIYRK